MYFHAKKIIQLSRLFFLSILILSCGCTETHQDNIFRFGLASAPTNFDPRFATDATSARLNRLLYTRLVDFDETARPIPALAEWKQVSPTHYRFYLSDIHHKFHNGLELTARDVKATYDFVLNPDNLSPHRSTLTLISEIQIVSDYILDFHLNRPDVLFPSYLVIGILPANLIHNKHPFHEHPIGSGPFSFVDRPDDTRWRLIRQFDGQLFEFLRIADPTVRTLKLLASEIDMMQNDLPPELISYLSNDEGIRMQRQLGTNFSYLGFNFQDTVVGQHKVRQAIAHAIDRPGIIQYVFRNMAYPANAIFPSEHWAGTSSLPNYDYDPQRARELLQQAGFDESHPAHIIYKTSTDPFRLRLATILQSQLEQVGIHTSIYSHDWGTFYGDIKAGRFQMYSLAWVGLKTPDIFHYAFHSDSVPPRGANRGRFVDHQTDSLIEQAQSAQDFQEKADMYRRLQAHLLDALPYVPLWFEEHVFIANHHIMGYTISADGNYDGLLNVTRTASPIMTTQHHSSLGH